MKSWPSSHPKPPTSPASSPRNCYAAYAKTPGSSKVKKMTHVCLIQSLIKKKKIHWLFFPISKKKRATFGRMVRNQPATFWDMIHREKIMLSKGILGLITPRLVLKDQSLQPRHSVGVTNANPLPGSKAWLRDYILTTTFLGRIRPLFHRGGVVATGGNPP